MKYLKDLPTWIELPLYTFLMIVSMGAGAMVVFKVGQYFFGWK